MILLTTATQNFRDHSGQNLAKLKIEVEHYLNNPLIIIILLKTFSQLLYVMQEIIISRENLQNARIIQGTPRRL